ncbi:MAG: hypothetical protein HFI93_06280 [Lachnospiraceae bacterium]|nr:hypothetical protein [Lachnospiraceae bacterium]
MKKLLACMLSVIMCLSILPMDSLYAQNEGMEQEIERTAEEASVENETDEEESEGGVDSGGAGMADVTEPDNADDKETVDVTEPDCPEGTDDSDIPETVRPNDVNPIDMPKAAPQAEENTNEILLNYLLVEKEYLEAGEIQNIVVSLGDAENHISEAALEYKNETSGAVYQAVSAASSEDGLLFRMSAREQGTYTLLSIQFTYEGRAEKILLADLGMKVQYGVGLAVDTEADDYLISDLSALELESSIVSVGENGVIGADSIAEALENVSSYGLRNRSGDLVVVLDPGHDNTHAGAQKNGYSEEKLVLKIARYCKEELEKYNGVVVYMTRESDACAWGSGTTSGECLTKRTEFAKEKGADVFVSFHLNSNASSSPKGAGVYYPNQNYRPDLSQEGHDLGRVIVDKLMALGLSEWAGGTLIRNSDDGDTYPDGSLTDYLAVIRKNKENGIPAVLIEHAFLSNSSDVNNFLNSEDKLKRLGVADAEAIVQYYGLQKGFGYKWVNLGNGNVTIGNNADVYYAVNKNANVTVQVFYGNNAYLKTLVSDQGIGTNDQVARWDLTDNAGNYVPNGTYRFTVIATTASGEQVIEHRWFEVSGNEPLSYKWVNLGGGNVTIGNNADVYYAVNKNANVTVQVFYGNNNYMKTLVSNQKIGTNDQVARWDLTDNAGNYVPNGTYRFTVIATTASGEQVIEHRWFQVSGNKPLAYKWVNLGSGEVKVGNNADLYYAVNKNANVTVQVFYGNNNYMKTLVSNQRIGTNDQVARWDLTDNAGNYVPNGTYRFTIIATAASGERVIEHRWFQVSGNVPLSYKWTNLGSQSVAAGNNAQLYYAVNKKANVTVQIFYGDNSYLKTLVSNQGIGTNDQVANWDLRDNEGRFVPNGTYRFTVIAKTAAGENIIAHKWFQVENYRIMGTSNTTVDKMVAYYNSRYTYPAFYANSEAPTIRDFCRIYYEECAAEGVKAEVAFPSV